MTDPQTETETFCSGDPLDYAMAGVGELSSSQRRGGHISGPIEDEYGVEMSSETANSLSNLHSAKDTSALVEAIEETGLLRADESEIRRRIPDLDEDDDADLGAVMDALDESITYSYANREDGAKSVSSKRERETVYIPDVVNQSGEGSVFMAKNLSTTAKVRMAWDLHDDNQILVVDDYDKWESLFGWRKLKELPHGKNKIKRELGGRLSDEVLSMVTADNSSSDTDTKDGIGGASGRRTRNTPTSEVLNLSISTSHRSRKKVKSEKILEQMNDNGYVDVNYKNASKLVLFPTTTDLNMTDHWWVAGSLPKLSSKVAIANCNKGTFEYLNQHEDVWHIEDYLNQAADYEIETNHGTVTLGTISKDSMVLHVMEEDMIPLMRGGVVGDNITDVLPDYIDENTYSSPDLPHADDMLYAPVTVEDAFWLRPELRSRSASDDNTPTIVTTDAHIRNVPSTLSLITGYRLYARARLPNWDFDAKELEVLDDCSRGIPLDDGGIELIETLAKLHDQGEELFSNTPESRWLP